MSNEFWYILCVSNKYHSNIIQQIKKKWKYPEQIFRGLQEFSAITIIISFIFT